MMRVVKTMVETRNEKKIMDYLRERIKKMW